LCADPVFFFGAGICGSTTQGNKLRPPPPDTQMPAKQAAGSKEAARNYPTKWMAGPDQKKKKIRTTIPKTMTKTNKKKKEIRNLTRGEAGFLGQIRPFVGCPYVDLKQIQTSFRGRGMR